MWSRMIGLAVCSLFLVPPPLGAQPEKWLSCLSANAPSDSFSSELELKTSGADSTGETLKTRALGLKRGDRLNLNLKITDPSNLAGTAFLLQEEDGQDSMHVYLPGLRKTRRVTGAMGNQELWGTSFSYSDIKQLFGAFAEGSFTDQGQETIDEQSVQVLELTPAASQEADYARMLLFVRSDDCVSAGMDIFSADDRLLKRLRSDPGSIMALDDKNLATSWTMQDLDTQRTTTATLADIRYEPSLRPTAFQTRGFENAR